MSELGFSLVGQGKHSEAEPLVVEGYEGLKSTESKNPPASKARLHEAEEYVVQLYESWGKPEKAAEWKSRVGLADLPVNVFVP